MFALLAAATTGTINFGETYSVKGDPNEIKSATTACYGQPHNMGQTCQSFEPVLDNVGGSMVFSASEQKVDCMRTDNLMMTVISYDFSRYSSFC
jgi:hypothetical protein